MHINQAKKTLLLMGFTCLLSACIGSSQSLTEEEKENLALLNKVNKPSNGNGDNNDDGGSDNDDKKGKAVKLSLLDAHQLEEKSPMMFKLVLNKAASQDISVSINLDTSFTHKDAQAKENVDFRLPNLTAVTIPAGKTETQFEVEVIDDDLIEATEQFKLVVSNLNITDGSAEIYKKSATGTILDNEVWRGPLNDTGIDFGADIKKGNNTTCTGTEIAAQDCSHGFDADPNENSNDDGRLGFSFTKLDKSGNTLPSDATTWSCVKDNRTGLIWEVKTAQVPDKLKYKPPYIHNPKYLHDKSWSYGSFDMRYLDGEYEGKLLGDYGVKKEDLTQEQLYGKDNVYAGNIDMPAYNRDGGDLWSNGSNACANKQWVCTTHQYTLDVNQGNGLCGFRDWRIPTAIEAETIVDYSGKGMDTNFFPHNISFWTKTRVGGFSTSKPMLDAASYNKKFLDQSNSTSYRRTSIRLVRGSNDFVKTKAATPKTNHSTSVQVCNSSIPATTPTADFQFNPNNETGTVKHLPTGLIWKRCPEKFTFNDNNTPNNFADDRCTISDWSAYQADNWDKALKGANQQPNWRMPNIKEAQSIIEASCLLPSYNLNVFPDLPMEYRAIAQGKYLPIDRYSQWSSTPIPFVKNMTAFILSSSPFLFNVSPKSFIYDFGEARNFGGWQLWKKNSFTRLVKDK